MCSSLNTSSSGTAAAIKLSLHLRWYDDSMIGLTEVGGQLDSSEGLLIANKKKKGWAQREQRKKIENAIEKVQHVGLQASVSCRGLQMAFRIKSKLCRLPRNGLCITVGNTGTEGKAATEGARAAAAVWKSLSNEFLKYLKINCLWKKKSTHGWYAGWMGAKRKVALSFNLSSFEYSSIHCTICFPPTFYSLLSSPARTPT